MAAHTFSPCLVIQTAFFFHFENGRVFVFGHFCADYCTVNTSAIIATGIKLSTTKIFFIADLIIHMKRGVKEIKAMNKARILRHSRYFRFGNL